MYGADSPVLPDKTMNIYLAGPLFTAAELAFNRDLAEQLRGYGHYVFLPQEHNTNLTPGYSKRVYKTDLDALHRADVTVAILDGSDVDSGTAWECGYSRAMGKMVYGFRTDIRIYGVEEEVNLMIQESCVGIYNKFGDLVRALGETYGSRL